MVRWKKSNKTPLKKNEAIVSEETDQNAENSREILTKQIVQAIHIVESYQKLVAEKDDFTADEMRWVSDTLDATHVEIKRLRAKIAGIDALVLETYEHVKNTVAPFGWESYLMKRFNLIAEHLGLLKNASE